jgi:hypothetical protein
MVGCLINDELEGLLKGSSRGLTRYNHENLRIADNPRFEPIASRIQIQNLTTKSTGTREKEAVTFTSWMSHLSLY